MCLGGAGCMWRTPLQALIIWSTISAAPRLCSRACWYRSLCFSISFSWGRARPTGLSEFRLSSSAFPLTDSSLFSVFLLQPHLLVHSFSCDPPLALGTEVCDLPLVPSQGWAHRPPRGRWIKSRQYVNLNEEKSYIFMFATL